MADDVNGSAQRPVLPRNHCEACRTEIPASELDQPEAEEYALYFCGPECFEKWQVEAEDEIGSPDPDNAN